MPQHPMRFVFHAIPVMAALGCVSARDTRHSDSSADIAVHEHVAPHHGTLVELGAEYAHLELVLDGSTGNLTAYALDGEAESPVLLAQKEIRLEVAAAGGTSSHAIALHPVANALTGETASSTSRYEVQDDQLKGALRLTGTIDSIFIRGQSFTHVPIEYPSPARK